MAYRPYHYSISTPRLTDGLVFTASIVADSKEQAERYVRESKVFRKTMRQNGWQWRTVPLVIRRTTFAGKVR